MKVIFSYEDNRVNNGSVRLRAFQVSQAIGSFIPVEVKPLSECVEVKKTLIFLIKPRNYRKIRPLLDPTNIIILDILDTIDALEEPDSLFSKLFTKQKKQLLKEIDGAIFCSDKTKKAYQHLFKYPEICTTIYHHWDARFTQRPSTTLNQVKTAYFGLPRKAHLADKLTSIDIHEAFSYEKMSEKLFPAYNAHYIVKPDKHFYHYEPLTKIATAAFAKSPVISRKGHEVELLTDDYPYYIPSDSEEDINATISKMQGTYQGKEWKYALSIMEDIFHACSLKSITQDYIKLIHKLSRI